VRDLARAAGVIGQNEDYVDLAVSGSTLETICNQYYTRQSGSVKVKVLIMDGGGIDMIFAGGSQSQAQTNVETFKQFLSRVKSDGTVQHIIYYIYPSEQVASCSRCDFLEALNGTSLCGKQSAMPLHRPRASV
jgi:hypothetical protein